MQKKRTKYGENDQFSTPYLCSSIWPRLLLVHDGAARLLLGNCFICTNFVITPLQFVLSATVPLLLLLRVNLLLSWTSCVESAMKLIEINRTLPLVCPEGWGTRCVQYYREGQYVIEHLHEILNIWNLAVSVWKVFPVHLRDRVRKTREKIKENNYSLSGIVDVSASDKEVLINFGDISW